MSNQRNCVIVPTLWAQSSAMGPEVLAAAVYLLTLPGDLYLWRRLDMLALALNIRFAWSLEMCVQILDTMQAAKLLAVDNMKRLEWNTATSNMLALPRGVGRDYPGFLTEGEGESYPEERSRQAVMSLRLESIRAEICTSGHPLTVELRVNQRSIRLMELFASTQISLDDETSWGFLLDQPLGKAIIKALKPTTAAMFAGFPPKLDQLAGMYASARWVLTMLLLRARFAAMSLRAAENKPLPRFGVSTVSSSCGIWLDHNEDPDFWPAVQQLHRSPVSGAPSIAGLLFLPIVGVGELEAMCCSRQLRDQPAPTSREESPVDVCFGSAVSILLQPAPPLADLPGLQSEEGRQLYYTKVTALFSNAADMYRLLDPQWAVGDGGALRVHEGLVVLQNMRLIDMHFADKSF